MPGRPTAHVGLLHRPGQAPRGTAPAQRRPQPGPGADMHGRGVHARLPAGHRDTAMRNVVVTGCPRADLSEVGVLTGFGVATVHEAIGRTGYLGPGIRPVHLGSRIGGTAVTAVCWPGDNLMIHAAVEQCRPGDILVVTTTSPSADGALGELLPTPLPHPAVPRPATAP